MSTSDSETDLKHREEEIDALAAIYADDFSLLGLDRFEIRLTICRNLSRICLRCYLPEKYPSSDMPLFELESEWLDHIAESALSDHLKTMWVENAGHVVVFLWSNWIQLEAVDFLSVQGIMNIGDDRVGSENIRRHDSVSNRGDESSDEESASKDAIDNHVLYSSTKEMDEDVVCLLKLDHMRQVSFHRFCSPFPSTSRLRPSVRHP